MTKNNSDIKKTCHVSIKSYPWFEGKRFKFTFCRVQLDFPAWCRLLRIIMCGANGLEMCSLVESHELALLVIAEDRIFNGFNGRVSAGGNQKVIKRLKCGAEDVALTLIVRRIH